MGDMSAQERRQYARSDVNVFLRYRVDSPEESVGNGAKPSTGPISRLKLVATFEAMTKHYAPVLRRLREQAPEVTDFLQSLDRKIGLIARALVLQDINADHASPSRVNLSAGGVGFYVPGPLSTDTDVDVELVLLPGFTPVFAHGRVVYARPDPEGDEGLPYYIGVEFVEISEEDRARIAQHVAATAPQPLAEVSNMQ
jgi:hypothetical protein